LKDLYTIGHSVYDIDKFVLLLKSNNIDTIVDVRSNPYSKYVPQYNKNILASYLQKVKINYLFMGDLLGAKYNDSSLLLDNGRVDFEKIQQTSRFKKGITRVQEGVAKGYRISLMCAEQEAFDCHRFGLISEFLNKIGINIKHIYPDKVVSQEELEQLLLKKYSKKLPQANLFNPDITDELRIQLAYELRNKDIAYNAIIKEGDE